MRTNTTQFLLKTDINQQNKIGSSKINLYIYGQLIFDRCQGNSEGEKTVLQQMVL